jgi:hypothetical protein
MRLPTLRGTVQIGSAMFPQRQQAYEQWKMRGESLFF